MKTGTAALASSVRQTSAGGSPAPGPDAPLVAYIRVFPSAVVTSNSVRTGLSGSTTIELIARPANASPEYVPVPGDVISVTCDASLFQVFPPSIDFQMPSPASESPEA